MVMTELERRRMKTTVMVTLTTVNRTSPTHKRQRHIDLVQTPARLLMIRQKRMMTKKTKTKTRVSTRMRVTTMIEDDRSGNKAFTVAPVPDAADSKRKKFSTSKIGGVDLAIH